MKIEMGKKYQTRNGLPVRILAVDLGGPQPVVGVLDGAVRVDRWCITGTYGHNPSETSRSDLVEVPEMLESMTIYAAKAGKSMFGTADFVCGSEKHQIEQHARRTGPVVEVTLPSAPAKKEPCTPACLEWHTDGTPEPHRPVLVDMTLVHDRGRYAPKHQWRGMSVWRWAGTCWADQYGRVPSYTATRVVHKWAYINEEN